MQTLKPFKMSRGILRQTILFSLVLALAVGFVIFAGSVRVAADPTPAQKAATYCQHRTPQAACQKGFLGQLSGQDVNAACSGLTNGDLDACQSAWGAAAHEDPAVFCNASQCDFVAKYINPAINLFSLSFGLIAVISIILGGIQYSASEGDPQKASAAKNRISNTIIAIFAYLFLYAFLQFLIPGGAFQ